jgi:hypothetical protein
LKLFRMIFSAFWEYIFLLLVKKFLDEDVLRAVLAGRRDDGVVGSEPSATNFRCRN